MVFSTTAKAFPLAIKMYLVPAIHTLTNPPARAKVATLLTIQKQFLLLSELSMLHTNIASASNQTQWHKNLLETLQNLSHPTKPDHQLFYAIRCMVKMDGYIIRYLPKQRTSTQAIIAQLSDQVLDSKPGLFLLCPWQAKNQLMQQGRGSTTNNIKLATTALLPQGQLTHHCTTNSSHIAQGFKMMTGSHLGCCMEPGPSHYNKELQIDSQLNQTKNPCDIGPANKMSSLSPPMPQNPSAANFHVIGLKQFYNTSRTQHGITGSTAMVSKAIFCRPTTTLDGGSQKKWTWIQLSHWSLDLLLVSGILQSVYVRRSQPVSQ